MKNLEEKFPFVFVILFAFLLLYGWVNRGPKFNGRPADYWVSELVYGTGNGQAMAMSALRQIDPETSLPPLIRTLQSKGIPVYRDIWPRLPAPWRSRLRNPLAAVHNRALIVATIGGFGPAARSAVPSLINLLKAPDVMVRRSAALALGKIGLAARSAAPSLIEGLKDPDPQVQKLALAALKVVDPESAMKTDQYWRLE
jgi:hypothetical protein